MGNHSSNHHILNESLWSATSSIPTFPPLKENLVTDICIVGGGVAGLTTAYMLTQAGRSVVVLDDGPLANGATKCTTAHLSNALDARYYNIENVHGQEGACLAAASHRAAINQIEAIVKKENISCDFHRLDGFLFLPPGEKDEILDRELAAARRAGITDVEKIERAPWKHFNTGSCLRFPNQGQFSPLKYLSGLIRAIQRDGGRLFTGTHVDEVETGPPTQVKAEKYRVSANAVVVATNAPINDLLVLHTKQTPYITYVIAAKIPHNSVKKALYWDTLDPYHYVRIQEVEAVGEGGPKWDMLIVGGEDHMTGQADDTEQRHMRLEEWARERFPQMEAVEFAWSGQVMDTIDGLAFIGRNPMDKENIYIVTGDCGMGMTHGTIAGILLTDLIQNQKNDWASLYDPKRKTLRAMGEYAKRALNMVDQYAEWFTPGDVSSEAEIQPGTGATLRRALTKIAVYRDEGGKLHEFSAICPHLGCLVSWNPSNNTWDCPCHGSRFDKTGKVIYGPANTGMTLLKTDS